MPTRKEHFQKAEGNRNFAESIALTSQPHIEWALTALFYAAVHFVEAYLADTGQHLKTHKTRDNVVARDSQLRRFFKQYQDLKYYGEAARYEIVPFRPEDFTDRALPALQAIEAQVRRIC